LTAPAEYQQQQAEPTSTALPTQSTTQTSSTSAAQPSSYQNVESSSSALQPTPFKDVGSYFQDDATAPVAYSDNSSFAQSGVVGTPFTNINENNNNNNQASSTQRPALNTTNTGTFLSYK
jgi:hypothetical protein